MRAHSQMVMRLSRLAITRANSARSNRELRLISAAFHYGEDAAESLSVKILPEMRRRRQDSLDEGEQPLRVYLCSPEDIILSKLDRFHKGGEVSEQQWRDILAVLKV